MHDSFCEGAERRLTSECSKRGWVVEGEGWVKASYPDPPHPSPRDAWPNPQSTTRELGHRPPLSRPQPHPSHCISALISPGEGQSAPAPLLAPNYSPPLAVARAADRGEPVGCKEVKGRMVGGKQARVATRETWLDGRLWNARPGCRFPPRDSRGAPEERGGAWCPINREECRKRR